MTGEARHGRAGGMPDWWVAVAALVGVLWLVVTAIYWLGGDGVQYGGASVSFERRFDRSMFRIDDTRALLVDDDGDFAAVVTYERGPFPFCPLCGFVQPSGSVVNLARYMQGEWIYTDWPGSPVADGFNMATGETFDVPEADVPKDRSQPPAGLAAYRDRGLRFGENERLTPARIVERFEPMRTINESCMIFNAAFLLIYIVWLPLGAVLWWRRRATRR